MHSFWRLGTPIWSNLTRSTSLLESWSMFPFLFQGITDCTTSSCAKFICNSELRAARGWYRSNLRHLVLNCSDEKTYQNCSLLLLPNLTKVLQRDPKCQIAQFYPKDLRQYENAGERFAPFSLVCFFADAFDADLWHPVFQNQSWGEGAKHPSACHRRISKLAILNYCCIISYRILHLFDITDS